MNHYIYLNDAAEKDAFYMGREAKTKIEQNKPVESPVK